VIVDSMVALGLALILCGAAMLAVLPIREPGMPA